MVALPFLLCDLRPLWRKSELCIASRSESRPLLRCHAHCTRMKGTNAIMLAARYHNGRFLLCGMIARTLQAFWLMETVRHRRVHDMQTVRGARRGPAGWVASGRRVAPAARAGSPARGQRGADSGHSCISRSSRPQRRPDKSAPRYSPTGPAPWRSSSPVTCRLSPHWSGQ